MSTSPLARYMTAKTIPLVVVAVFLLAQVVWASLSYAGGPVYPTISGAVTGTLVGTVKPPFAYNSGTGSGRALVMVVGSDDRTKKISTVTYGGVGLTEAQRQLSGGTTATAGVQIFYLANLNGLGLSGSNNIAITASGSDNYAYVIAYVSGTDDTAPIGTISSNSASSGSSLNVSNTPTASDSLILAGFASDSTASFTPSGGSTEVGEISSTGIRAGMYTKAGGSAGVSVNTAASGGSLAWGAAAIEIKLPVVLPEVNVSVGEDNEAQEPGNETQGSSAYFIFSRNDSDGDLQVVFDRSGSAQFNEDYDFSAEASSCESISGDSIVISSGRDDCTLYVQPLEDEDNEDTETVDIDLDGSSSYVIGDDSDAVIYINDTPPQGGGGGGVCQEYWCQYVVYSIDSPGYASMYVYDDDTVPSGQVNTFTATPTRVQNGGVATLSWNIAGMSECSIDNGVGSVDATDGLHTATTPAVTQRTTFTLSCSDGVATVISRVSVGIVPSFIEQ